MNAFSALWYDAPIFTPNAAPPPAEHLWHIVRGLEAVSLCDWPGHMSLVVFCGGCNALCPTCHNGTMAWQSGQLSPVDRQTVAALLRKHRAWYEGIVVSGGEPTIHETLPALLADLHALSTQECGQPLPIKLDSNGMQPAMVAHVLEQDLVAHVAVDVKGCFTQYPALTGGSVSPEQARTALTRIFELAEKFPGRVSFRLTQVPLIKAQHVEQVRAYLPAGHSLSLQSYVPPRGQSKE